MNLYVSNQNQDETTQKRHCQLLVGLGGVQSIKISKFLDTNISRNQDDTLLVNKKRR